MEHDIVGEIELTLDRLNRLQRVKRGSLDQVAAIVRTSRVLQDWIRNGPDKVRDLVALARYLLAANADLEERLEAVTSAAPFIGPLPPEELADTGPRATVTAGPLPKATKVDPPDGGFLLGSDES